MNHLKLYKIIGYTDKDTEELKQEITNEIIEELCNPDIELILKKLIIMIPEKIELIKKYVELLEI